MGDYVMFTHTSAIRLIFTTPRVKTQAYIANLALYFISYLYNYIPVIILGKFQYILGTGGNTFPTAVTLVSVYYNIILSTAICIPIVDYHGILPSVIISLRAL
jgi:hypothetical protein